MMISHIAYFKKHLEKHPDAVELLKTIATFDQIGYLEPGLREITLQIIHRAIKRSEEFDESQGRRSKKENATLEKIKNRKI